MATIDNGRIPFEYSYEKDCLYKEECPRKTPCRRHGHVIGLRSCSFIGALERARLNAPITTVGVLYPSLGITPGQPGVTLPRK